MKEIRKEVRKVKERKFEEVEVEKTFYSYADRSFDNAEDALAYKKAYDEKEEYVNYLGIVESLPLFYAGEAEFHLIKTKEEFKAFQRVYPTTEKYEIPELPFYVGTEYVDGGDYDMDRRYWYFLTKPQLEEFLKALE